MNCLLSCQAPAYLASRLAFGCEGGRVPSGTASSIGFHPVCYRIRKGSGAVSHSHQEVEEDEGEDSDWMSRWEQPSPVPNRQEPTPARLSPTPTPSVPAPGRGRDQICITVNHQALRHNDPSGRGWRSSSDNCLHTLQF